MLGTYALSAGYYDAYYLKAQKVRTLIKGDFDALWAQGFDALVAPTSPTVAFRVRRAAGRPGLDVPLGRLHAAGQHGRAARASRSRAGLSEGLPVGLQLIGAPWSRLGSSGSRAATRRSPPTPTGATLEPAELAALDDPPPRRQPTRSRAAERGAAGLWHDRDRRPPAARRARPRASASAPCRRRGSGGSSTSSATMDDVISLGVGEPDFDTPRVDRRGRRRERSARAGRTTPATTGRSSCAGRSRPTSSGATASATTRRPSC